MQTRTVSPFTVLMPRFCLIIQRIYGVNEFFQVFVDDLFHLRRLRDEAVPATAVNGGIQGLYGTAPWKVYRPVIHFRSEHDIEHLYGLFVADRAAAEASGSDRATFNISR